MESQTFLSIIIIIIIIISNWDKVLPDELETRNLNY